MPRYAENCERENQTRINPQTHVIRTSSFRYLNAAVRRVPHLHTNVALYSWSQDVLNINADGF